MVLVSCASGGSQTVSGGGNSPTDVARKYFLALWMHRHAKAHKLACPSGWQGSRSFRGVGVADGDPTVAGYGSYYFDLSPIARRTPGGWLVSLEHKQGPLGLPQFRVVQIGGRYFVCGFVKR
jgi:hypothetical protein